MAQLIGQPGLRPRESSQPRGRGAYGWAVLSLPMLAFLILPLTALLARTPLADLGAVMAQPAVRQAIALSLKTSLTSSLLIVLFGTPLGYLLARRRFPLRPLVDTLVDLPVVLPPAVAGVALLMAFGRRGLLGGLLAELDLSVAFTSAAVVMAQVFVSAPYFVRSAVVGFSAIDAELEQAAALDGASIWQSFRLVTAPLTSAALLSGAMLAWARALGEFGATIIFAGNFPGRTQTMPLAIYMGFEMDSDVALMLSVILVASSLSVLMAARVLLHRRTEELGRD